MSQTKRFVTLDTPRGGGGPPLLRNVTPIWVHRVAAPDTRAIHTQKFSQKKDPPKKPQKKIDRF